jgi:hypothetical protein
MSQFLGSIVVPAHNEALVIESTLRALADGLSFDAVRVVVACNGCTDDTVAIVRSLDLPVEVLDLGPVGKIGAIRAAEALGLPLPRLYLDADVVVNGTAATAVLHALADTAVAARPPIEFDVVGASWAVRRWYACRAELPTIMHDLCGAGLYGLSRTARERFDEFPDVVADDLFAARIVDPAEVVVIGCDPVQVSVPRTARALVATLARVFRGNRQLAATSDRETSTTRATMQELARLARRPQRWLDIAVYIVLVVAGRRAAGRADGTVWERDETARRARAETVAA